MAQSADMKVKFHRAVGRLLAALIRLVQRTSRTTYDSDNLLDRLYAEHPAIVACWHGQFMMLCCLNPRGENVSAMVARHGDAEIIGEAMKTFDVTLIRGAGAGARKKDRGGVYALRASVKALGGGSSLVMTADVPPGPARVAGLGIVMIAKLSGRPLVPAAAASSRFIALKTWSRLTFNLPFSKLAFALGEPIYVPADAGPEELEELRRRLQDELNEVTRRAYEVAGADISRIEPPAEKVKLRTAGEHPAADENIKTVDDTVENVQKAAVTETQRPRPKPGAELQVYRAATTLLRPVAPALLRVRERYGKEDARRRPERFGQAGCARPDGLLVWVHAASVGETNAALPVINAISEVRPDLNFLLTTGTVTSAGLAAKRLSRKALHQYVPLDAPRYAQNFLAHWKPDLAVFTESEIWPNLILETARRDIPLALINARMSSRSFERWQKYSSFSQPLFSAFDLVMAQNEEFGGYFSKLDAARVVVTGNLKIDAPPPPVNTDALEAMQSALAGRPCFVAASTHDGEETIVAEAHRNISRKISGFCTIIAPRHPERGTAIAEMLRGQGLRVEQRSVRALPGETCDVYVADTIGELGMLYALCPVAFIGGSLVAHGGQNPVEAIRHNTAVISGPYTHNFRDAYTELAKNEGAVVVDSADGLAETVARLHANAAELDALRASANKALDTLAGALDRTVAELLSLLPAPERMRRAS